MTSGSRSISATGRLNLFTCSCPLLDEVRQDGANQRRGGMQVLLPSDAGQSGLHGRVTFTRSSTLAGRCSSLRAGRRRCPSNPYPSGPGHRDPCTPQSPARASARPGQPSHQAPRLYSSPAFSFLFIGRRHPQAKQSGMAGHSANRHHPRCSKCLHLSVTGMAWNACRKPSARLATIISIAYRASLLHA